MLLKVLFGLALAAEFVTVPMFLKYYWPKKCKQSLLFKMLSATLFVAIGFLALKISGNATPYATYIMWGLVLGWIGDFFLHSLSDSRLHFVIGFLSFLAGHFVYIAGFQKAIERTYPSSSFFEWYEILCVVLSVGIYLAIFVARKLIKEKILYPAFIVYGAILSTMLVKTFRYAIGEWVYGTNDHVLAVFLTMVLGAVLFTVSDALLGVIIAKGENKRIARIINIVTYFAAQVLIGCSIFFVRASIPLY